MNHLDAFPITLLLVVVGVAFLVMCAGMGSCLRQLRNYRRELTTRAKALRIHKMLARLGVNLGGYLKRTPAIDVERQLDQCRCCPDTGACDDFLEGGKETDPGSFCPNFRDLQKHQSRGTRRRQLPDVREAGG